MIINVRGINGSGKSTIVKKFLEFPNSPIFGALGPRRPEAYEIFRSGQKGVHLYAIGPYTRNTGGVDGMGGSWSAGELVELLEKYRRLGHVIFEGVVISTYYGAIGEWLKTNSKNAIVVFLDTPLDVCLESIGERSGDKARTKTVEAKVRMLEGAHRRMIKEGIRVETLSRDVAFETIAGWLKEA